VYSSAPAAEKIGLEFGKEYGLVLDGRLHGNYPGQGALQINFRIARNPANAFSNPPEDLLDRPKTPTMEYCTFNSQTMLAYW
jgi:hypothetical protein